MLPGNLMFIPITPYEIAPETMNICEKVFVGYVHRCALTQPSDV